MEIEDCNWKDLRYSPWLQGFHPLMISPEGYKVTKFDRLKGDSHRDPIRKLRIHYDREFVVKKICRQVLKPLEISSYNELQAILKDCWKLYKEEN